VSSYASFRTVRGLVIAQILFVAVLVACSGATPTPTGTAIPSEAAIATVAATPAEPSASPRPNCRNQEGQNCLNELPAGTYTTEVFTPTLTYTVPDGWANWEDTPGNFLLVPPGGDLPGVNADTSDFVGVYTRVMAPNGCEEGPAPGVGVAPADLKAYYEAHPGLEVTSTTTSIGGRNGFRLEVRMKDSWTKPCSYSAGHPIVPMLLGLPPSGLDHNIGAGRAWHLDLLERGAATLAVEVVDINDGAHLADYDAVVEQFVFGPG
jgi:hypothetical protein